MTKDGQLEVKEYCEAVQPLLDFLREKCSNGNQVTIGHSDAECDSPIDICVSDVRDDQKRQYVDLIQEGGGVHGIALAGYTYVLEKCGIAFMKMAGTSAGAINTMLLNAVCTRDEVTRLKANVKNSSPRSRAAFDPSELCEGKYYCTRSEKLLEYLANKKLAEFVDGHTSWKRLLLSMFNGNVDLSSLKRFYATTKQYLLGIASTVLVLLVSTLGLVFSGRSDVLYLKWTAGIAVAILVIACAFLAGRAVYLRLLYRHAERFGINPGDNFEKWVQEKLNENGVITVDSLTEKLKQERDAFGYRYDPCSQKLQDCSNDEPSASVGIEAEAIRELENIENVLESFTGKKRDVNALRDRLINLAETMADNGAVIGEQDRTRLLDAFSKIIRLQDKLEVDIYKKEIVLVASDITNEIKVEFPGMHRLYWGNNNSISPAKYVRASMSVPFFFKPFEVVYNPGNLLNIDNAWKDAFGHPKAPGKSAMFVDGGILSNFPLNVFYNPDMPIPRRPTFGVRLEYEDNSASNKISSLGKFLGSMVSTMRFFYDREFASRHNAFKKTVRSIDTGKVHWLNFNLSEKDKIELFYRGALAATIFLGRRCFDEQDLQALIEKGCKVKFPGEVHSIYESPDHCDFKIEDKLVSNITFDWQCYKRERLNAILERKQRRAELKENAALLSAEERTTKPDPNG